MLNTLLLSVAPFFGDAASASSATTFTAPAGPRLLTDQQEDGTVWARGETYKLAIAADGARFIPRERASTRLHDLRLGVVELDTPKGAQALEALAPPVLDGRRVTIDRGSALEVWDLEPHGARQSFVLRERPELGGDLVLRLPLGGSLAVETDDDEPGIVFRSPGGARVHYGEVLAFDSAGLSLAADSRCRQGAIELRLPAAFASAARYPLTVDPFIAQFPVDLQADDHTNADSAADSSLNVVLVAIEDRFSAADRDIVTRRFNANGGFLDEVAVDISDDDTVQPAVAGYETVNRFMVVWLRLKTGLFTPSRIEGRSRAGASTSQGSERTISFGQGGESRPDIGGPSTGQAGYYFVVWSENGLFNGKNVRGRYLDSTGNPTVHHVVSTLDGDQTNPVINQASDLAGRYLVMFDDPDGATPRLSIIFVFVNGVLEGTSRHVSPPFASNPDIAGDGHRFLAVYELPGGSNHSDIGAFGADFTGELGEGATYVLTDLEPGAIPFRHQFDPAVAVTQNGFAVTYSESLTSAIIESNVFAAALDFEVLDPNFLEGHVALQPAIAGPDTRSRMGSFFYGTRCFSVWNFTDPFGGLDVHGALYEVP